MLGVQVIVSRNILLLSNNKIARPIVQAREEEEIKRSWQRSYVILSWHMLYAHILHVSKEYSTQRISRQYIRDDSQKFDAIRLGRWSQTFKIKRECVRTWTVTTLSDHSAFGMVSLQYFHHYRHHLPDNHMWNLDEGLLCYVLTYSRISGINQASKTPSICQIHSLKGSHRFSYLQHDMGRALSFWAFQW